MIRSFLCLSLSFLLLFQTSSSAFAFDFKGLVREVSQFGSVQNAAEKSCLVEPGDGKLFEESYENVCKVLRESELCQDVQQEDKLECEDVSENEIEVFSFRFLYSCGAGLIDSLVELFKFLVGAIKGILGYTFSSETRNQVNEALGEYYDSFANYLVLEFDKAREETDSDFGAIKIVAGNLLKTMFTKLKEQIEETYYGLGCYNQAARAERLCRVIGDVIMPPVIALKLIFNGPKWARRLVAGVQSKVEEVRTVNREKLALVSKDSKVLKREARSLTPEEMRGQNIKRLAERMSATMKANSGVGLAAPQVGQGIKLIVFKDSKGAVRTMGNPKVSATSARTSRMSEGCLSLKGMACSVERPKDIEVTYLNLEGQEVTERFSGRDATVIQHEADHIDGILMPFKSDDFAKKFGLKKTDALSDSSRESLGRFLMELDESETKVFKSLSQKFEKDFSNIENPNSLLFSVVDEAKLSTDQVFNEVLNLYSLAVKSGSSAEKFKKYSQWVKSDAHALYLYDHLSDLGLEKNKDLLRYLSFQNEYFKKAHGLRGPPHSLVTYSFEKESAKPDITLWYKKADYSDEDWMALSEEERLSLIRKATNVKKKKVSSDRIASTGMKPHYVGDYSEELGHGILDRSYGWEIANKKYEIDLDRLMGEVKEVSESFKETHSFHTHVVFDMPKDYKNFDKFSTWSKHVNDYLYLSGMEEGLHGNYLTGLAHFADEAPSPMKSSINNAVPEKQASVNYQSHKFFSMGIRGDLYGDSPIKDHVKMGLELRDTTRKLDKLEANMKGVSEAVQDYRWEKWPADLRRDQVGFLRPQQSEFPSELMDSMSKELKSALTGKDVGPKIPLQKFEEGKFFDFKSASLKEVTSEQRERIQAAREFYYDEIAKLDKNVKDLKAKGESFEKEDLDMALKMVLTEWANKARVSELYAGF